MGRREHQCHADGCDSEAEFSVKMLVWSQRRYGVKPIEFICPTTVEVCGAHRLAAQGYILNDRNKATMTQTMMDAGIPPPDFDSAKIEFHPIRKDRKPLVIEAQLPARIMACDIADCLLPAKYQIGLHLFRIGSGRAVKSDAKTLLNLCVCETHKKELKLDDVLTPESKSRLLGQLTQQGFPLPDFKRTRLEFIPLKEGRKVDPAAYMRG